MSGVSHFHFGIQWRRLIHRPLVTIFRVTVKHKIRLVRDDFSDDGKPVLFAATHVFYDDIAAICCCLKKSAFVLLGVEGTGNTPNFLDRLALFLNGVIIFNRTNMGDRTESVRKMVAVLRKRGNVLLFPEGAWNLSPNLLAQKLNWGILDVAERSNANIVPVAVDLVNGEYRVIIGAKLERTDYGNKADMLIALRDAMATLTWELIRLKPKMKRQRTDDAYWLNYIQNQLARVPKQNQEKEESYVYRSKGEISLGELLADLHGIEYKSMAADYAAYQRVESLIKKWTKPVDIKHFPVQNERNF